MLSKIRLFVAFTLLITSLAAVADEGKSFSRQMNEIKRSGDYVYAESSAPNEADAKAACDALLKIEITKYLVSVDPQSQTDGRIIRNISEYNREYLVQPRGDMIRVFGYVTKSSISSGKKGGAKKTAPQPQKADEEPVAEQEPVQEAETVTEQPAAEPEEYMAPSTAAAEAEADLQPAEAPVAEPEPQVTQAPAPEPVSQPRTEGLKTDGLQLARWQTDMLENIVREPDMPQAKKLLNRYKSQNRIKRLGDRSVTNPRPADSFYLIYGDNGTPAALLAPSSTGMHYDMLSGTTVNLNNYTSNQYYWFQISQ
ncbi:MAG: hypothetical protein K2N28_06720 [Muribaculaceae bacterium]|nr:hypothetical protein [Muribaculaceae bacterium]